MTAISSFAIQPSAWRQSLVVVVAGIAYAIVLVAAFVVDKAPLYAAVALLPVLVYRPVQVSMGLFVLSVPFDTIGAMSGSMAHFGSSLGALAGAGAGAVLLVTGLATGRLQRPPKAAVWWGLYIGWCLLSVLWAMDSVRAWERFPSAISLCALYLVCVSFRFTEAELRFILSLVVLGGVLAALLALKGFAAGITGPRASLMIGEQEANPNDFASSMLLPFAFALTAFFAARTWPRKTMLLMVLGVIMFCVFLTMSRGSLFALGVLGLVFLTRTGMRKQVLLPIVLILVLLFFLPGAFFSRMEQGVDIDNHATGRFDIWMVGVQIVKHHGIVGAGLQNFQAAFNEFAGYAPVFHGFDRDPHNIFLEVWSEMGIVGLLLFLAAIGSQLRAAGRRQTQLSDPRNPPYLLVAAEAACWGLLAHGLGANLLWRKHFWLAWILLAIIVTRSAPSAAEVNSHHA